MLLIGQRGHLCVQLGDRARGPAPRSQGGLAAAHDCEAVVQLRRRAERALAPHRVVLSKHGQSLLHGQLDRLLWQVAPRSAVDKTCLAEVKLVDLPDGARADDERHLHLRWWLCLGGRLSRMLLALSFTAGSCAAALVLAGSVLVGAGRPGLLPLRLLEDANPVVALPRLGPRASRPRRKHTGNRDAAPLGRLVPTCLLRGGLLMHLHAGGWASCDRSGTHAKIARLRRLRGGVKLAWRSGLPPRMRRGRRQQVLLYEHGLLDLQLFGGLLGHFHWLLGHPRWCALPD